MFLCQWEFGFACFHLGPRLVGNLNDLWVISLFHLQHSTYSNFPKCQILIYSNKESGNGMRCWVFSTLIFNPFLGLFGNFFFGIKINQFKKMLIFKTKIYIQFFRLSIFRALLSQNSLFHLTISMQNTFKLVKNAEFIFFA